VSLDLLDALLITPIQRLPRYNLLLSDLIKNTEDDHPDLPDLKKALDMMLRISERVNERIKQSENIQKLQNIVRSIIFDTEDLKEETALVKPDRVLIREGDCNFVSIKKDSDKCDKKKKPAHLFLFNDLLVMTMRKRMTSYYLFRQAQDLRTGSAEKLYEDPTRMLLKNLHEPIAMLFFVSEDERDQWVYDIQRAHSQLDEGQSKVRHSAHTSASKPECEKTDGGSPGFATPPSPGRDPSLRRAATKSNSNPEMRVGTIPHHRDPSQHAVPVPTPAPMPMPAKKTTIAPPSPVPLPRSSMKVPSNTNNNTTSTGRPLSQQTIPIGAYSTQQFAVPQSHGSSNPPTNPRLSYRSPKSPISAYNPHHSANYGSAPSLGKSLSATDMQQSSPPYRSSLSLSGTRTQPAAGSGIAPPPPFAAPPPFATPNSGGSDIRPPGPAPPTRAQSFKQQ